MVFHCLPPVPKVVLSSLASSPLILATKTVSFLNGWLSDMILRSNIIQTCSGRRVVSRMCAERIVSI